MRKLFQIMLITAVVLLVSCGGGGKKSKDDCPTGYDWSGTDCVKTDPVDTGEPSDPDTDTPVDDGDVVDDNEPEDDGDTEDDSEKSEYNGSCTEIRNGDSFEVNVETKKLTIGSITVNGKSDDAALFGEIWAENRDTLSEFKVGDVNSEFSGKTMNIPKGRYSFAFRSVASANKIAIEGLDNIDMAGGDRKLDFDLPLYHLKGKVLNNADAAFTVEEAYQAETKLILKTGTFEKVIPYSEFAGYDVLLPKGTYSVAFKGQLAAGEGVFEGTVLDSGNNFSSGSDDGAQSEGLVVEEDKDYDIKVKTITFAGSIVKGGYAVTQGRLVVVENPPFGSVSGVVAADLSAASYNITVTAGAELNLIYEPQSDSYPVRYIKLETWNSKTETPSAHNISLDFGRVYGKITFMGGNNFPTVANCSGADCTIGKLKATGFDNSSLVIKDLGTALPTDEEGNVTDVTYEALLVRRIAVTDSEGVVKYNSKTYTMDFESHLNDIKGGFASLPFTVKAVYSKDDAKFESFSFAGDEGTWELEKEINFDISPKKIEGKVTLNGSTFDMEKDDLIKLKDETGMEYAVVNLSELSGGNYSFYAPAGNYNVLYDGEGLLSSEFKTFIEHDFLIEGNGTHDFEIKTGKITLDFNVNGTPFAEWAVAQKNLDGIGLAVNIDKTASDFVLDLDKKDGKYVAEVLTGSVVNAYLELAFADKVASEKSYSRIRLLSSHNMTSGTIVKDDLTLVKADISVKLNGKSVKASQYAAKLKIQGTNLSEIYCPAEGSVSSFFKKGEYKTPNPEFYLNEGFDANHEISLNCLYFGE
ncbi:hypothetical protein J6W78_06910 [bacterium]|nr:hypothetical protein [bacterium]